MLTIEVKSNRDVIVHLEVTRVASDPGKKVYCISNVSGRPTFAMPTDSEWNHVVRAAIDCAVLEGKKEKYDREMRRDNSGVHTG
jgi:hypothetical protein